MKATPASSEAVQGGATGPLGLVGLAARAARGDAGPAGFGAHAMRARAATFAAAAAAPCSAAATTRAAAMRASPGSQCTPSAAAAVWRASSLRGRCLSGACVCAAQRSPNKSGAHAHAARCAQRPAPLNEVRDEGRRPDWCARQLRAAVRRRPELLRGAPFYQYQSPSRGRAGARRRALFRRRARARRPCTTWTWPGRVSRARKFVRRARGAAANALFNNRPNLIIARISGKLRGRFKTRNSAPP